MSVEQPLWRALTGYRVATLLYAIGLHLLVRGEYAHPVVASVYIGALTVWTACTAGKALSAERCTVPFLAGDLTMALTGIVLTRYVASSTQLAEGVTTLPSIWTAGAVLGCAIKGGWRWGAAASALVGIASLLERGGATRDTVHNVLLVCVASIAIGYVVEVARASERTLARALRIEAATRERERLARDIHDSVLQVLAMVQRRGAKLGGDAAELGRLAGEQEVALRALVSARSPARDAAEEHATAAAGSRAGSAPGGPAPGAEDGAERTVDLHRLLAGEAGARVTFSGPGTPVRLAAEAARELAAAVAAALDNVRRHAGEHARAWILLEDEPDSVLVSVRDDGPGIPAGRLEDAEAEGRMGVALSIRGRLRELGGTAELVSVPGQGTEVELRMPKHV
ncbi:sensor histidine kinase [Streptomyces armeniacus]|uniref:Sensor histidine kinase n=2 Tax=Streptomyces armeniacus TaxID=83291 RepID=A0A345XZW2_9ACTN|nr:sensor histidine kinase [Streptomyces armeniacus]